MFCVKPLPPSGNRIFSFQQPSYTRLEDFARVLLEGADRGFFIVTLIVIFWRRVCRRKICASMCVYLQQRIVVAAYKIWTGGDGAGFVCRLLHFLIPIHTHKHASPIPTQAHTYGRTLAHTRTQTSSHTHTHKCARAAHLNPHAHGTSCLHWWQWGLPIGAP